MSFVKLDHEHQTTADTFYEEEAELLILINRLKSWAVGSDSQRWLSIGLTDIEKGFMALRKGITLSNLEVAKDND